MKWEDLPESKMVADRRGKKKPETFTEQLAEGQSEPQPERGPPDPTNPLAKQLGVDDVNRG